MDVLLTLRSFTHSLTGIVYPILVYAQSPHDVEIARHEHLATYAFHYSTDHALPGLAPFPLACPPAVRLCIRANLVSSVAPPGLALRSSTLCTRLANVLHTAKDAR